MIYHLSLLLRDRYHVLNVIHYVSFRAMAGLLTALFFSFLFGNMFIDFSKKVYRSKAREWTPKSHQAKNDMPTMGGLFIVATIIFSTLLWANLSKIRVWIFLGCLTGFGLLGFWDDWRKINAHKGISARSKFALQIIIALSVVCLWLWYGNASTTLSFPFFKNMNPNLGWFFVVWAVFIIVGTSNAVNLTDGLDGLAIGSLIITFSTFSIMSYLAGHVGLASYLHIPFVDTSELVVIGGILVGASIGFLWYNAYPAQIFMGDVGSLALGSVLGLMALMTKQELLLPLVGGVFMAETVSVILQVLSFRYLGRRVFKMAPMHHHFELKGWQESKITVRFGIVSLILSLIALMTLKMR